MTKRKILIPIDGTERSFSSLEFIKSLCTPDTVEITIMNVKELVFVDGLSMCDEIKHSEQFGRELLNKAREMLQDYDVKLFFTFGYAGDEIVKKSNEDEYDAIVMTKSTKSGLTRIIGSCTSYVLKHSKIKVMVIPK